MTASPTLIEPSERCSSVRAFVVDHTELTESGWKFVSGLLSPYCARPESDSTVESLIDLIQHDHHQLWILLDRTGGWVGAVVTVMEVYPNDVSALSVVAAATDDTSLSWDNMRTVVGKLEEFALEHGMQRLRIAGRPGWSRVLEGFSEVSRTIEKTL